MKKKKKENKKEGSALCWVSFPFLKCFLWILGEELKRGEQLYQKAWEAGSGKSHLVVMWVWKAYEKERVEENILLELNK